ncbi:MAG: UDP-N-acetylmuramate--L-alanine ligase [Candidatus Riflebacteria bacterium]|nr:UDP-N-acetylmuramate--L-alanine ligase [Candidatus Riflebacteria bacterium]
MNAYFIGIGGMGMSGLAKILYESGFQVAGSDRNIEGDYCVRLKNMGIKIYPQDGTGLESFMSDKKLTASEFNVVKSTAVEDTVSDVVSANRLGVNQIMRSDLLADMFNAKKGIAIGGTAGKTTTTGLVTWILKYCCKEPSCAVGGIISGLDTNAFMGRGENFVIEADESDGSIVKYNPYISVVTNVSRDHKPLEELLDLFSTFINNTEFASVLCADNKYSSVLKDKCNTEVKTYSIYSDADYKAQNLVLDMLSSRFTVNGVDFEVKMPGEHNVLNSLAAIAVCNLCGLCLSKISEALYAFPGMKRRFEMIGEANGVIVIDDFAHNPAEIEAAVIATRKASKNRFIVYQPHGFGPTNFTKNELIDVFSRLNATDEYLFLDEIFYGGGTVNKDISSKDIVDEVAKKFKNAFFVNNREDLVATIASKAKPGDIVLVMGARDINQICPQILTSITSA